MKYKETNWKVGNIVYFADKDIIYSSCLKLVQAKKIQNTLSITIAHLAIMVVLIRCAVAAFY
jgi:hypothetical protein